MTEKIVVVQVRPPEPLHFHWNWRRCLKAAILPAVILTLCAFWRWGPFSGLLNEQSLHHWAAQAQGLPLAPLVALACFFAGCLVMLPVVLLIGATGLIFGPWLGAAYALAGAVLSALAAYGLGLWAGQTTVSRFTGGKLGQVGHKMADHGLATVILLRVLPVAPFTLINLAAGASRLRLKHFLVGTILGMIPVTLAVTVFADRLRHIWQEPLWEDLTVAAGALVALALATWLLKRLLHHRHLRGL